MFTLKIENSSGAQMTLTQNESVYSVVSVKGLSQVNADIHTSKIANLDGERYKSARLSMRDITLQIRISGDVEANRIRLYDFFQSGLPCKLFYKNGIRDIYCEGYVEKIETDLFTRNEISQISIVCPTPYLYALYSITTDISKAFGNFTFPFSIAEEGIEFETVDRYREVTVYNRGEAATGINFHIEVIGDGVANPVIYNVLTGEFFRMNIDLNTGDEINISTHTGKKSITLTRDGINYNIINTLAKDSTWHMLNLGGNVFSYNADTNPIFLNIFVEHTNLYKGV